MAGKPTILRLRLGTALCGIGIVTSAMLALPEEARASERSNETKVFDIEAKALDLALLEFAEQANVQIAISAEGMSRLQGQPVRGRFTPKRALRTLIDGAPVSSTWTNPETVSVRSTLQMSRASDESYRVSPRQEIQAGANDEGGTSATSSDDIIVTARRREERLQDVPVAVTALNGAQLDRANVVSIQDLKRVAPSITVTPTAGAGRNSFLFTIRGQRQADTLASVDPSVAVYIGDQLFKRTYGLDQIIFDMASVEVLKGPQGTLFGLNTTGGNIIFRPALPSDRLEASAKVGIGNFNYRGFEAMLNVPLAENVAVRVAGQYKKRDGYIHDVLSGERDQDLDGGAVRGALRIDLQPFETIFSGSWAKSSTNGMGFRNAALQKFTGILGTGISAGPTDVNCTGADLNTCTAASAFGPLGFGEVALAAELAQSKALGFYEVRHSALSYARTDPAWNIANTSTYDLSDDIKLKNVIGYRKYQTSQFDDFDGSGLAVLEFGNRQRGKEFSEEFQILGSSGDLNWIAGAYYFQENVNSRSMTTSLISPRLDGLKTPYTGLEIVKNTSRSIFASGTQKLDGLVGGLSLTLGGRYTWDKREGRFGFTDRLRYAPGDLTGIGTPSPGEGCTFNPVTDPNLLNPEYEFEPSTCLVHLQKSFSAFTYTASIDWKVAPDKLVYLVHRKGYRSGGIATRATLSSQLFPFRPEIVRDLEVGAKLDFHFDNGMFLRTNFAAYKQWYSNIQRQVNFRSPDNTVLPGILNAASATIKGIEAEVTFRPVQGVELGGFVAHVDPVYNHFFVTSLKPGVGEVDVGQTAPFGGTARWQFGLSGAIDLPVPESLAKTTLSADYFHQSSLWGQDMVDQPSAGKLPGYGIMNARLQLQDIGGSRFSAAAFVTNLLDKKYLASNFTLLTTFGVLQTLAGPPRMYGFELKYVFD